MLERELRMARNAEPQHSSKYCAKYCAKQGDTQIKNRSLNRKWRKHAQRSDVG